MITRAELEQFRLEWVAAREATYITERDIRFSYWAGAHGEALIEALQAAYDALWFYGRERRADGGDRARKALPPDWSER